MTTYNLGTLASTPVQKKGFTVTKTDPTDVFAFEITGTKTINLGLDSLTGNTNLNLYQDVNENGVLDNTDQFLKAGVDQAIGGGGDEGINFTTTAGKYLAQVSRGRSVPVFDFAIRPYNLKLSATSVGAPSNVVPSEVQIGNLPEYQPKTFTGTIDNTNTSDVYAFSTYPATGVDIRLTGLTANANIRLIEDRNSNGLVDVDEVVQTSSNLGSLSEKITSYFGGGNYLLQVYQASGNTNYSLQITGFGLIE